MWGLYVSVVAAQQFGISGPDRAAVSMHHHLQLVLIQIDHGCGGLLSGREEQDGKDGHFKLRTHTNKGAGHWFDQTMPAELHIQDMVIFIRLHGRKTSTDSAKTAQRTIYFFTFFRFMDEKSTASLSLAL